MNKPAQSLIRGDVIICPTDGAEEQVDSVAIGRAFICVRTNRHDHIRRIGSAPIEVCERVE